MACGGRVRDITMCRLAIFLRRAMRWRWWALAGRQWRNPRAHRLPWRESSSSSFLRDDPGACLYSLLGLDDPKATQAQIKHAFRSRARALHPDIANDDTAVDAFVRVVAAYEILSCSRRRAAYDATRRAGAFTGDASSWGGSRAASASSSSSSSPRPSPFDESETFRTYAASIDALVPRMRLRDELYAALAHVIHGGTQLDVAEVESGRAFPRYFEAEERAAKVTATRGVDLMHVVAGRTLLAAVRERVDAEITARGEGVAGHLLEGDGGCPATTDEGEFDAEKEEAEKKEEEKEREEGDDGVDARLELVVGGRVVATATRRRRGGDVTVFDARGSTASSNAENEKKEASLLRADVNNWGGHPRAGTAVAGDGTSDEDAYASRGARGEAFTISGLRGSFDGATVFDAKGEPRHAVVAHATPGVTHLHWFDAITGVCVGRGTRAWVPPSDLWLFAPRSDDHDAGGWYFELPPGPPGRDEPRAEREPSRRLERGDGRESPRRHVFDEFVEDFGRGFGLGAGDPSGGSTSSGDGLRRGSTSRGGGRRGAPLPPAAALFTVAFRLLDRERGEDHGVGGAVRRAWAGVFGSRY